VYGIASLSDNIGEAIYAATSPVYKQWTPDVRKDADAEGIPNTVGDRYRYFIDRAVENVKTNPGFYIRNVGMALWEYANTFGPRSRASTRYLERFSLVAEGQKVFLAVMLVFTLLVWLLRRNRPFAPSNLLFADFNRVGCALSEPAALGDVCASVVRNCFHLETRPQDTKPDSFRPGGCCFRQRDFCKSGFVSRDPDD
jgi:hypothetical protein